MAPEWILEPEALGSKQKFWYRQPHSQDEWLFKYPRKSTGEHWAEKIAAEVAASLRIPHATVELACYEDIVGSTTLSFVRGARELIHGNQILAGKVLGYEPERRFRNSDHTLANIWLAQEKVFRHPLAIERAKCRFGEYLILDALIGNTDRHHENWGVIQILGSLHLRERSRRLFGVDYLRIIAPSFDHASSLGRELVDSGKPKSRNALLADNRVGDYAENGRGGIYWSEQVRHGVSPIELVRRAAATYPEIFEPGLEKARKLKPTILEDIINRIPTEWMTSTARRFAYELMCYAVQEFRKIGR